MSGDHQAVARALRSALPDIGDLAPIGEGFGGLVFRSDTGLIVRVARSPEAARAHARLLRVLPALAPHLPVAIPVPTRLLPASAALPHGALVYPALPGEVARPARLTRNTARQLAGALVALHSLDPSAIADVPRHVDDDTRWEALRETVRPACAACLTPAELRTLDAWWTRFLAAPERRRFTPAPCHGDLWHENVLLNPTTDRLTGILDWENVNIGDPAQDLAPLRHAGRDFADQVLQHYLARSPRSDVGLVRRVQWFWDAREFDGLRIAIVQDDADEIVDAIAKIRRGPILAPGEPWSDA